MQLKNRLRIIEHDAGYYIALIMPDNSNNFLHTPVSFNINDVCKSLSLLQDLNYLEESNLTIDKDGTYYRIKIVLSDCNDTKYYFHSRKLNLNDALSERRWLLE